jgi:uncharacterized protein DUF6152
MRRLPALRLLALLALSLAVPAWAHHSFAMFDQTKTVTLKGSVIEFQWTNPHAFLHVEVAEGGKKTAWHVELNSPNNLRRQGWRATSVKAGDAVTVLINPLRDGTSGGLFISVTLPDGTTLGEATRAGGGPVNVPVVP